MYFTGAGPLDTSLSTVGLAPASPLARTAAPFSATIGGAAANVFFLGLTPGFIGLGQGNMFVPEVPPGDHLVVITIGGVSSNGPIISVQ